MRKTRRTSKVGEVIRDALVDVFRYDLKHISLGLASITGVDVSPDLHFARVFISGFKEDETKAKVKELQSARGRIRGFLGKRIHLRYTPELDFKYDETTMRASRIEELLTQVKHDNEDDE
ncbi:MAG TPA: 30S ribosome-binding factor RbfA [Thermoanaerobaculia bacterium]|jgi:ribosome-binding factor A|nr:30S ribosome-binding factor RbfA [Thermoanaerobaculia bacterium]